LDDIGRSTLRVYRSSWSVARPSNASNTITGWRVAVDGAVEGNEGMSVPGLIDGVCLITWRAVEANIKWSRVWIEAESWRDVECRVGTLSGSDRCIDAELATSCQVALNRGETPGGKALGITVRFAKSIQVDDVEFFCGIILMNIGASQLEVLAPLSAA